MIPTRVLRHARSGFGLSRGHVRVLSTRFGKVCLAHRAVGDEPTQIRLVQRSADTRTRLDAEMRWLTYLAHEHGLSVPVPRQWRDGRLVSPALADGVGGSWHAVACSWVTGRHLNHGLRARDFAMAGGLLAHLHRANANAPAGIADARPIWWIPRLFELATTLRDVVADAIPRPAAVSAALADGLRRSSAALESAYASLPHGTDYAGLIHTDAHWQNLRFSRRRVGLVDFEDFATGRFMLDVACLWGKVESRRGSARMLDAILDGYDRVSALPAAHRRDLRVMLAFRRFDYAGWVLSWPRPDSEPWGVEFLAGTPDYIERLLAI